MKLETLFASVLNEPVESINDETSPKNTGSWNSLKHVSLILAIENAFSVKFTMPEITSVNSVSSIKQLLQAKGVAG